MNGHHGGKRGGAGGRGDGDGRVHSAVRCRGPPHSPGDPLCPAGADGEESGREGACAHGADSLYCTAETSTIA